MKGLLILALAMTLQLATSFECFQCSNDVNSDKHRSYCSTDVEIDPDIQVETCADGVTSCYLEDYTALDRVSGEIRTVGVSRGCVTERLKCDSGSLVNDDVLKYISCCNDDRCNEAHLLPLPEKP